MSDAPTKLPGSLLINVTSNQEAVKNKLDIPEQVIYLRSYRIEMDSAANALTEKVLYLDLSRIFNSNKMIDGNVNQTYFPLLLDNATVTLRDGLSIPIAMKSHLPEDFEVRILNGSFVPVSNFVSASLIFELQWGHSN